MKSSAVALLLLAFFLTPSSKAYCSDTDSVPVHRLLIIPFPAEYYLSDADQDIMKQTRRNPDEYRAYFRKELDLKITGRLETIVPCISLLQDTSESARGNLAQFFGTVSMSYQQAKINKKDKKSSKPEKISAEIKDQHQAPQYITTKGDAKYMEASLQDTTFLSHLAEDYNNDLILSINQFEIKTNYNSCIDISNRIYKREVFVHYTLMDLKGNILSGNFETGFFPSNSNKYSEIAEGVFPAIADHIKEQLQDLLR